MKKSFDILPFFSVFLFIFSLISTVNCEKVITPFGIRPKECVHHLRKGHRLNPTDDGVEVIESTHGRVVEFHPTLEQCMEDIKNIKPIAEQKEATFPINGWLDYVSFTPSANVKEFSATYTVPAAPTKSLNQVLFYFIGVENFDSNTVTILQPVLTWGNGHTGWNMASWNCCPSGQTWTSDFILNLEEGDVLQGYINVTTSNSAIVSTFGDQTVTLEIATNGRNFNWMDVTLEVYSVVSCSEFAASAMTISNLAAVDVDNNEIKVSWADNTGSTACSGYQSYSETTWINSHSA
jgi:hypothetical protein